MQQVQGDNKIPKPIEVKEYEKFVNMASNIANHFKTKIDGETLTFSEKTKNINDSQEYKDYLNNGVTQNQGTHCNKYKGNLGNQNLTKQTN